MYDIVVVGGGPAGLSAAITARQRNNTVAVVSNDMTGSGLYKAALVDNYPGIPGVTGPELLDKLMSHALKAGAEIINGKVISILPSGDTMYVGYDNEVITSKSVILATGIAQTSLFPGEEELLGLGVSYCATCDGMLYRGKRVCVACLAPGAEEEADYLASIGCDVVRIHSRNVKVVGDMKVSGIIVDDEEIECEGFFILRQAVAPHLLLKGLETEDGYMCASATGQTNIPGVFAAGDCVGVPHQIAKATGQGQIAALSASEYIQKKV